MAGYNGDGGQATAASLNGPGSVTFDHAGNLYFVDEGNNKGPRVDARTGIITTFAGTGVGGSSGDAGAATSATLRSPIGLALSFAGVLYIVDQSSNNIRAINLSTNIMTTVAGNGTSGYTGDGGAATSARLYNISDLP